MREELNAIEARGLVKRFGKTTALAGVDLTARAGSVLGLLGPNGAGKTTAVRILATLLRPDEGEARVCGYDVVRDAYQVRQLTGLTGQYASVDEGLSGTNNLVMIGRLLGMSRAESRARAAGLLARFELTDAAGRPAKTYSGGMRRRLDLAASLVGRPRVLYLDEPTTGLDPYSRNEVWAMIRELVTDGTAVLLTTQYLDEADQLAHDIVVIDQGGFGHACPPSAPASARAVASFHAIQPSSAHLMRAGYLDTPANATASSRMSSSGLACPLDCISVRKASLILIASPTGLPITRSVITDALAWLIEQPRES